MVGQLKTKVCRAFDQDFLEKNKHFAQAAASLGSDGNPKKKLKR